jgi:hypothetical protein
MAIDTNFNCDISIDNNDDDETEERKGRIRVKSHQRIRSYQQLLEDFQEQSRPGLSSKASRNQFRNNAGVDDSFEIEDGERDGGEGQDHLDVFYTPTPSIMSSPVSSPRKQQRREDTARRSKRFSLPAIGLHTTVVTARTSIEGGAEEVLSVTRGPGGAVAGLSKRYSLVLAGRNSHPNVENGKDGGQDDSVDLGLAAARLSELLSRKSTTTTTTKT